MFDGFELCILPPVINKSLDIMEASERGVVRGELMARREVARRRSKHSAGRGRGCQALKRE